MTIRCLYWDDDPADLNTIANTLRTLLGELRPSIPHEVVTEQDLARALSRIQDNPTEFKLIVADLLVNKKDRGTTLINLAHRQQIPVIAISDGGYDSFAHNARSAGAVEYISKRLLPLDPIERSKLREALDKVLPWDSDDATGFEIDVDPVDLQTLALVERMGLDRMTRILKELMAGKTIEAVTVEQVGPGLSGAVVFRADVEYSGRNQSSRSVPLLVKASEDERLIRREADKYQEVAEMFSNKIIAQLWFPTPVQVANWTAIAMKFAQHATPLSEWLSNSSISGDEIGQVMQRLFGDNGLGGTYRATFRSVKERASVEIGKLYVIGRRAHAKKALDDLKLLLGRHYGDYGEFSKAEAFVEDPTFGRAKEVRETFVAFQHGDLHGDNILVDPNFDSLVIDPVTADMYHWSLDFSRLVAHLTTVVHRAGPEIHEWDELKAWTHDVCAILSGHDPRPEHSALVCARWILTHVEQIFPALPPTHYSEIEISLAGEYLRVAGRSTVPMPRRVLAIYLAGYLLQRA